MDFPLKNNNQANHFNLEINYINLKMTWLCLENDKYIKHSLTS